MDEGEYEVCSYCNKSVFPGVATCPYCGKYTDGNGPYGTGEPGGPRRLPKVFIIAGVLVVIMFVLPFVVTLLRRWF